MADPIQFTEILNDTFRADSVRAVEVIAESTKACKVADLADVDSSLWGTLLRTNRVQASAANILKYFDRGESGATVVDADLAALLNGPAKLLPGSADNERRIALALAIANAETLSIATKIRRILNLDLSSPLPFAGVTSEQAGLLGELLRRGALIDSGANMDLALTRPWPAAKSYLARSGLTRTRSAKAALTPEFVQGILGSRPFNPRAQRAVFDRVLAGTLDQSVASFTAAARLAGDVRLPLTIAEYTTLSQHAVLNGDLPARLILALDGPLPASSLIGALSLAGGEYAQLAYRRHHTRSSITRTPANEELLGFLASLGLVGRSWLSKDQRHLVVTLRKPRPISQ